MFKRIVIGGSALTAAYLVGGLTLGGVLAQTNPTASPTPTTVTKPDAQTAAPDVKKTGEQVDATSGPDEAAALVGQAKITADQASAAALAKFPSATVGKIELGNENGVLAYSVKLTDSSGQGQDVSIDATSGTVLAAQADGGETPGAPEGPETGD